MKLRSNADRVTVTLLDGKTQYELRATRKLRHGFLLMQLDRAYTPSEFHRLREMVLQSSPEVEDFSPNATMMPLGYTPRSQLWQTGGLWNLQTSTSQSSNVHGLFGAVNAEGLWDVATGSRDGKPVVVAVIDTGIIPHPSLAGRVLPGYDFISSTSRSGDGDGRDADPTDEGNFCGSTVSFWHGTKVASVIAGAKDREDVVGLAFDAQILPLRALGRCGGTSLDVDDAIEWAAGVDIGMGIPVNPHPAKVINLSLGESWIFVDGKKTYPACNSHRQAAIDAAIAKGAIVVSIAGNDGLDSVSSPANCKGVVSVAAHTGSGDLAGYSNYDPAVPSISAPVGGRCKSPNHNCFSQLIRAAGVVGDGAVGTPTTSQTVSGTSFAGPQVAAVIAALAHQFPDRVNNGNIHTLLRETSRPFAPTSVCSTTLKCGVGMLDAARLAERVSGLPRVKLAASADTTSPAFNQQVRLMGTVEADTRQSRVSWQQSSGTRVQLQASGNDATFQAPSSTSSLVMTATATPTAGDPALPARATVELRPMFVPQPAPSAPTFIGAPGSGGGGGNMGLLGLVLLAGLGVARRLVTRKRVV